MVVRLHFAGIQLPVLQDIYLSSCLKKPYMQQQSAPSSTSLRCRQPPTPKPDANPPTNVSDGVRIQCRVRSYVAIDGVDSTLSIIQP